MSVLHLELILIELFSHVHFILYDPRQFDKLNAEIHQEFFTDEKAKYYSQFKNLLFISDIRNMDYGGENSEKIVKDDMEMAYNN